MRRVLCLAMAGAMCLGLTACSGNDEADTLSQTPAEASAQVTMDPDAQDVTPEWLKDAIDDPTGMTDLYSPEFPTFEPTELDQQEKMDELTYSVSKAWKKQTDVKDENLPDAQIVEYETSDNTLQVAAVKIDEDTEAKIRQGEETNDWDGILALWTQNLSKPNTATWFDSLQVYVPGARIAWEISATADDMDIPAADVEAANERAGFELNPSAMNYRGLVMIGNEYIYMISYSALDYNITGLTEDWDNLVASCQIGDGTGGWDPVAHSEQIAADYAAELDSLAPGTEPTLGVEADPNFPTDEYDLHADRDIADIAQTPAPETDSAAPAE